MPCDNRWMAVEYQSLQYHVIPADDLREHEPSGQCWCNPSEEDECGATVYVHNSLDGREDYESGVRKPN